MIADKLAWKPKWIIKKFENDTEYKNKNAYEVNEIEGNLLLNEGITELLNLLTGIGGTTFSNGNAYIGVGDDATAESAAQTGLIGTNKLYKQMDVSFPSVTNQTVTFESTFTALEANFHLQEFTVANGSSNSAKNLNRKVSDQGTKTSGQTWVVTLQITVS
jgi:hypothetical protein